MKKFIYLGVALIGFGISLYGNKKVKEAVREELQAKYPTMPLR